jgi:transposase
MKKKNRHSFEFKLYCVKQMSEHYRSAKSLGEEYGITYSLFEDWFRIYGHLGAAGLLPRKGKRVFSPSFKLAVLKSIREEKLSLRAAVLRFGLSSDAGIIEWQKRFEKFGSSGLEPRPKGRLPMADKENPANKRKPRKSDKPLTREQELLRENEYLRAENALLKKLQALVQAENKRKP